MITAFDELKLQIKKDNVLCGQIAEYLSKKTRNILNALVDNAKQHYDVYFDVPSLGHDTVYFLLFDDCAVSCSIYINNDDKHAPMICLEGYSIKCDKIIEMWVVIDRLIMSLATKPYLYNFNVFDNMPEYEALFNETISAIQPFSFVFGKYGSDFYPIDLKIIPNGKTVKSSLLFANVNQKFPYSEIQSVAKSMKNKNSVIIKPPIFFDLLHHNMWQIVFKNDKNVSGIKSNKYVEIPFGKNIRLTDLQKQLKSFGINKQGGLF